jgi:hypothetical protein
MLFMKSMIVRFIVPIFFALSLITSANPIFDGPVRYQFSNNNSQVTLTYTKIQNSTQDYNTGTIKVSLWACDNPYSGGTLNGVRVADFTINGLGSGQYWHSGNQTLNATIPEYADYYFMVMTVEEYGNNGYFITDWVNFDQTAYLNRPPPPKPAKPAIKLTLEGPYRWQTNLNDGTIEIKVGKISHNRNGQTGTLRIQVWATKQPYKGGNINGWILGKIQREPLQKGMMYPSTHQWVPYKAPPPGNYYITIALQEYDGSAYFIRDYFTFDGTQAFR